MTVRNVGKIAVVITADEGMMLTRWKEGIDITEYEGSKNVGTRRGLEIYFREITIAEHEELEAKKQMALDIQNEYVENY